MPSRPSEYKKRPAPPPARSEQNPAKKFSFPFRRKNRARAKSETQRKLFCWVASGSERRRGGFIRRGFPENAFGFRSGCGAKKLDTNSDFEDERVRSPSPANGGAGLRSARATPSFWREMKRILMLSGE